MIRRLISDIRELKKEILALRIDLINYQIRLNQLGTIEEIGDEIEIEDLLEENEA